MGKTYCKAKISRDEFKINIPKNPLINNQVVTIMRNLTTCKVEFNQPLCWLCSVNLLVIQHLEIMYLGGNHVRVVCEKV